MTIPRLAITHWAHVNGVTEDEARKALEQVEPFVGSWGWAATHLDDMLAACASYAERLFVLGWTQTTSLDGVRARGLSASYWREDVKHTLDIATGDPNGFEIGVGDKAPCCFVIGEQLSVFRPVTYLSTRYVEKQHLRAAREAIALCDT